MFPISQTVAIYDTSHEVYKDSPSSIYYDLGTNILEYNKMCLDMLAGKTDFQAAYGRGHSIFLVKEIANELNLRFNLEWDSEHLYFLTGLTTVDSNVQATIRWGYLWSNGCVVEFFRQIKFENTKVLANHREQIDKSIVLFNDFLADRHIKMGAPFLKEIKEFKDTSGVYIGGGIDAFLKMKR